METTLCTADRRAPRRLEAVERAEAYVREHSTGPLRVSQLCRAIGLSERGLRDAFQCVKGISPKRYILAERLRAVRGALSDVSRPPPSVTAAATSFWFYELGRFAGSYRKAFGEAPSETLRNTRRSLPGGRRRSTC